MKNIALIGMMGTMKTSVGKRLAEKLGMTFVDTDAVFEREEGASIKDTFACKGEAYFRDCETAVLATACSGNGCVISCGGGVPLKEENVGILRRGAVVVLLTASPEKIYERTCGDDSRPLLCGGGPERVRLLCEQRWAAYERAADLTVDTTSADPDAAADEIIARLKTYE